MTMKDYEYNSANDFNKMLKKAKTDTDRADLMEIAFNGICKDCGAIIGDGRCYCMRDD